MQRKKIIISAAAVIFATGVLYSCSKSSNNGGNTGGGGNNNGKDTILANIGNNIIMPAYVNLSASVNSLDSTILDFNASPTDVKLGSIKSSFKTAYNNWHIASAYNYMGPATTNQPLLPSVNVFPASAATIESNITGGNNNVNAFTNVAAKGFPALDYLLAGPNNALVNFTTGTNAANRKAYLAAVSADIKTEVGAVYKGWQSSGGNYLTTFLNGTGNSISSSLGLLINSLDQDFEILKNYELGIPLGKQPPGQTLPVLPDQVEAYYSGISAQLALTQLKAAQGLFLGTATTGAAGPGLKDYLIARNAQYHGGPLADTIKLAFATAVAGLQAIPDPFSQTIQNNPAPATAVYVNVQKLVVLLKTDMPSALGVLITYGDNDGD